MKLTETHISIIIIGALIGVLWLTGGWLWHKDVVPAGTTIDNPSPSAIVSDRRPIQAAPVNYSFTVGPEAQTQTLCFGDPYHRTCRTIKIAPEPATADDCGSWASLVTLRKYGIVSHICVPNYADPVDEEESPAE
jgi:hypothetical protein